MHELLPNLQDPSNTYIPHRESAPSVCTEEIPCSEIPWRTLETLHSFPLLVTEKNGNTLNRGPEHRVPRSSRSSAVFSQCDSQPASIGQGCMLKATSNYEHVVWCCASSRSPERKLLNHSELLSVCLSNASQTSGCFSEWTVKRCGKSQDDIVRVSGGPASQIWSVTVKTEAEGNTKPFAIQHQNLCLGKICITFHWGVLCHMSGIKYLTIPENSDNSS